MPAPELKNVQFVSKPIQPPFRDGTKCLVRDLCLHLTGVSCHVLSGGAGLGELEGRVVPHAVYGSGGSYRPGLLANLRAAAWLGVSPAADAWHFVFAPNRRSSQVGAWLKRLRGVPTVQTIASPPRGFQEPHRLLFGDRVVAQSQWTREQFIRAFAEVGMAPPPIEVIFPPAPTVVRQVPEVVGAELSLLGLDPRAPFFLYPGDLEVSSGAELSIQIAEALREQVPGAKMVLAYRRKTERADALASELRSRVDPSLVLVTAEVKNILALMQASSGVVFPVDDLYGKVDLPIVLLEALALGVPVFALAEGPLLDLDGAELLGADPRDWASALARLLRSPHGRQEMAALGKKAVSTRFAAEHVAGQYGRVYQSLW